MQSSIQRRSRASGFSLIEVLVALLVLSFGLLGMVGLQATAMQNNREARLQSVAVDLARELAEMMRGNKDVAMLAAANPYVGDFSATAQAAAVPASPSSCLSTGSSCANNDAVASAELTDWLARVSASLPGARVKICPDSAPYSGAGLPQWNCTASASTDVIVVKIGWTHLSTDGSLQDRNIRTTSTDDVPRVILPVTAGSTTS
ncbi:type IV pilus modification protein PilV [Variovorax sp. PBS-H4]|uniref:type IV pilus modification protein PilV n=1 Tax=Variovorax sp. PBS-H4 TaxID=434008 RepID=UPI001317FF8C|nr:type IV pilus modification protein PilV [Variovorax sp. PBS-H4]VTU33744.1 type IV pilus modification protein PilV [Variovorax sp. PBS-H4]